MPPCWRWSAALLALGIAWSLTRTIGGRLAQTVAIASGQLDSPIPTGAHDEPGPLLTAFGQMQDKLRGMIQGIKRGTDHLVAASHSISANSQQLSAAAQEQSSAASSMEQLTLSINHVSDNAGDAHDLSSQSGRLAQDGGQTLQASVDGMRSIAGTVQSSATRIGELGEHFERMSSIVSVIKGIADQTNLLALNAAIEAALAGEQDAVSPWWPTRCASWRNAPPIEEMVNTALPLNVLANDLNRQIDQFRC